jgi:hypothetical protein
MAPRGRATGGAAGAGAEVGAGTAVGARWSMGRAGKPGDTVGDDVEDGAAARTRRPYVSRTGRSGKPGGAASGAGDGSDGAARGAGDEGGGAARGAGGGGPAETTYDEPMGSGTGSVVSSRNSKSEGAVGWS